jgi:hypothetical protein
MNAEIRELYERIDETRRRHAAELAPLYNELIRLDSYRPQAIAPFVGDVQVDALIAEACRI